MRQAWPQKSKKKKEPEVKASTKILSGGCPTYVLSSQPHQWWGFRRTAPPPSPPAGPGLTSPHRDRHSNKQLSFSECMCWEGREQGVFPIGVESDGSELMQPCLPKYISALQPCLPEYISAPQHISELAAQPTFWKRSPLLRVAHSLLGPSSYSHFPPGSLKLGMGWGRWEGVPSDQLLGLVRPQAWNRGRKTIS